MCLSLCVCGVCVYPCLYVCLHTQCMRAHVCSSSLLMTCYVNHLSICCRSVSISQGFSCGLLRTFPRPDSTIFISFTYLFIPSDSSLWFSEPPGLFGFRERLVLLLLLEFCNWPFQSKLSHWRWWFSWGEQTHTGIIHKLARSHDRGSKPAEKHTTTREKLNFALVNIFISWFQSVFLPCLCYFTVWKHTWRCQKDTIYSLEPGDPLGFTCLTNKLSSHFQLVQAGINSHKLTSHYNLVPHNHRRW